jgi:hypothetical protein
MSSSTKFDAWLEAEREVSQATRALGQALAEFGSASPQYQAQNIQLQRCLETARSLCTEVLAEFQELAQALRHRSSARGPEH